jgi:hypothetical protein
LEMFDCPGDSAMISGTGAGSSTSGKTVRTVGSAGTCRAISVNTAATVGASVPSSAD